MSPIKQAATAALPKSTRVRKAVVPYSASPVVPKKPKKIGKKPKNASNKRPAKKAQKSINVSGSASLARPKVKKTVAPKKSAAPKKGKVAKAKKEKVPAKPKVSDLPAN